MSKKRLLLILLPFCMFSILLSYIDCTKGQESEDLSDQQLIARGKYLVEYGSCQTCHTPKISSPDGLIPDSNRHLSGHPSDITLRNIDFKMIDEQKWILFNDQFTACAGPWGIIFSANISSHEETGIGQWKEEQFNEAMRSGVHVGINRLISPPMCWVNMSVLTDQDLKSIFVYLKQTKPVNNYVPAFIPRKQN